MGKIDCPSCKKQVDEDMLFCPYCFSEFDKAQGDDDGDGTEGEEEEEPSAEPERPARAEKPDFLGEGDEGLLIDNRYSIIEPYHFTCSRAIYKVEDLSDAGTFYSLREFLIQGEDLLQKEDIVERFEEAAERYVNLSHPSIIKIFDYFNEENYLYLVYEFMEGKNFTQFLPEFHTRVGHAIPEGLLISWGLILSEMLEYLHGLSPRPVYVVDMPPSSLVIDEEASHIYYINIGIPHILSAVGMSEGDEYVEKLEIKEEFNSASRDIWCLGAFLYFLISSVDLQKYRSIEPEKIESLRPDLSKSFVEILYRMLGTPGRKLSHYESVKTLKHELLEKCRPRNLKTYDFYYTYRGIDLSDVQWDNFLGNTGRTSSVGAGPRIPMKRAWSCGTRNATIAHLAPCGDKLLVSFNDGHFFLFDMERGSAEWSYSLKESINAPVVHDRVIYVSSPSTPHLVAIKAGKSSVFWEAAIEGMVMCSPCAKEDILYQVTYDGTIVAIELSEGEIFWREPLEVRTISAPALYDEVLYLTALNGIVYAVNLEDRDFLWQFNTEGSISTPGAVLPELVIAGNHEGFLFCIERQNGDLRWEYDLKGSITHPIRAVEDMVICITQKGIMHHVNAESGEILWKVNLGSVFEYHYAVTHNKIYVLMPEQRLYCFDSFTGKLLDKVVLDEKVISVPLIVNGALFLVTQSGTVLCYR
ncbi:MAG: PQQ-binding-like beta-propeller repeat protein [Candidatus Eremiobacteraeota bacterium]|nr:PQQ-binding-like beta-propeller repeat protein [Candidatus Eremiobacteraeota bacterium]